MIMIFGQDVKSLGHILKITYDFILFRVVVETIDFHAPNLHGVFKGKKRNVWGVYQRNPGGGNALRFININEFGAYLPFWGHVGADLRVMIVS